MPPETSPAWLAEARHQMVRSQIDARGISDQRILDAMARVPRHEFVPRDLWSQAYEDHPLPIGEGQTISQPYIVAIMLQALGLKPVHTVLEIGTGSGYQTALLAELCFHVYSIERHQSLARNAERTLGALSYKNVTIVAGDGSNGLPGHAPYDAIIVSAATAQVPPLLFEQLADGGRMIVPVGPPEVQQLLLVHKRPGAATNYLLDGCRFVPLVTG